MHSRCWIRHFIVKIFIDVTGCMGEIVGNIISIHVVVMDVHTTVLTLGLEVEPDIVPVSWPHFIVWVCSMSEILGKREGQTSGF